MNYYSIPYDEFMNKLILIQESTIYPSAPSTAEVLRWYSSLLDDKSNHLVARNLNAISQNMDIEVVHFKKLLNDFIEYYTKEHPELWI